ncbi:MAG: hypothetical protein LBS94_05325 [Prevotellaceae bacterium]|jgi:hypothetical protein|nr:hypothetical protein [Prevotellaceae bacterium]
MQRDENFGFESGDKGSKIFTEFTECAVAAGIFDAVTLLAKTFLMNFRFLFVPSRAIFG